VAAATKAMETKAFCTAYVRGRLRKRTGADNSEDIIFPYVIIGIKKVDKPASLNKTQSYK
jgi:hypothetical protein